MRLCPRVTSPGCAPAGDASAPTFLLSSAASSFFWISSKEGSRRRGREALNSGMPSKEGGFRITSKDCPEVRLLSSMTSMSEMTHQVRSTVSAGRGARADCWHGCLPHPPTSWGDEGMEGSQLGVPGGEGSSALKLRGSGEEKTLGRPPPKCPVQRDFQEIWKDFGVCSERRTHVGF